MLIKYQRISDQTTALTEGQNTGSDICYSKWNEKIRNKKSLENISEMEKDIVKEEAEISWFRCCLGEKMELSLNKERRVVWKRRQPLKTDGEKMLACKPHQWERGRFSMAEARLGPYFAWAWPKSHRRASIHRRDIIQQLIIFLN